MFIVLFTDFISHHFSWFPGLPMVISCFLFRVFTLKITGEKIPSDELTDFSTASSASGAPVAPLLGQRTPPRLRLF